MVIRSFTSDSAFRALSDRPFQRDGQSCVFGRRTLIYGRNGSGKTTLSELLRLSSANGTAEGTSVKVSVREGTSNKAMKLDPSFGWKVFVYNRGYVKDSLGVFVEGTGGATPITVKLGAKNVKAAAELDDLLEEAKKLEGWLAGVETKNKDLERARDDVARSVQAAIITALSPGDAAFYNPTRFTIALAKRELDSSKGGLLATSDLATTLETATSAMLDTVPRPAECPVVEASLASTINSDLLSAEVDFEPIDRFRENPKLADWVEAGLTLHAPGETCKFCEQGIVSAAIIEHYKSHFNDALDTFRKSLSDTIEDLQDRSSEIDEWVGALPDPNKLLPSYRTAVKQEIKKVQESANFLKSELDLAIGRMRDRLADPLRVIDETKKLNAQFTQINTKPLLKLLMSHEKKLESQESLRNRARAKTQSHFAAERRDDYANLGKRIEKAVRARTLLRARIARIHQQVVLLRNSMQDTTQMATFIDSDIRDHFNFDHIKVTASTDGKSYVVLREGKPATDLSEGERNALALTYFLRTLEADEVELKESIIIIDDPVTSLDKEALFSGFSLINQRTDLAAQVIFLTHDFEYFRLLLNDHKSRRERSEKKLSIGDANEAAFPAVSVLEVVPEVDAALATRKCSLRAIPKNLLQHPSEYHYLFHKIAVAVEGSDTGELPLLGNAARRLLEGFISFRAPSGVDFQSKIDSVVSESSINTALAERVVKFLHGQSHREDPRPSAGLDFPSVKQELQSAMSFIHLADERHFALMCKAVGINESALVGQLTSTSSK